MEELFVSVHTGEEQGWLGAQGARQECEVSSATWIPEGLKDGNGQGWRERLLEREGKEAALMMIPAEWIPKPTNQRRRWGGGGGRAGESVETQTYT